MTFGSLLSSKPTSPLTTFPSSSHYFPIFSGSQPHEIDTYSFYLAETRLPETQIDMPDDPMGDPIAVDHLPGLRRRQAKSRLVKAEKMARCQETLKPLADWQTQRMRNRAMIVRKHTENLNLSSSEVKGAISRILFDIAVDRQLYPIPVNSPFYNKMDTNFAFWFLSFIMSPYTTSPDHPALKQSSNTRESEEVGWSKYYIRFRKETRADLVANLEGFLKEYPAYAPEIEPKLLHLQDLDSKATDLYTHYVGYTTKEDVRDREREDRWTGGSSLLRNWTKSGSPYEVYEIVSLRQKQDAGEGWLNSPQLWIAEYLLEMASSKTGFNSSVGGVPQVSPLQSSLGTTSNLVAHRLHCNCYKLASSLSGVSHTVCGGYRDDPTESDGSSEAHSGDEPDLRPEPVA